MHDDHVKLGHKRRDRLACIAQGHQIAREHEYDSEAERHVFRQLLNRLDLSNAALSGIGARSSCRVKYLNFENRSRGGVVILCHMSHTVVPVLLSAPP